MKIILLFACFYQIGILSATSTEWTDEERLQESQQIDYWRAKAADSPAWSDEEKLRELTSGLRNMFYRSQMDGHNPEIDILFKQLQGMAATIPNHAKYFTSKIDEAWKSNLERIKTVEFPPGWEKFPQDSEIYRVNARKLFDLWGNYPEICSDNIEVLGHIPSTESVRALGNYLRERDEPNIKYPPPDTGRSAAEGLMRLISDGPVPSWYAGAEDVLNWQRWFDEVKAGKRTFRFVGSDVDYTLEGPADARTMERINRVRNQENTEAVRKRSVAQESLGKAAHGLDKPGNTIAIIASLVLVLGSLIWYLCGLRNATNRN